MKIVTVIFLLMGLSGAVARSQAPQAAPVPGARSEEIQQLRAELARISARLDALERTEAVAPAPVADAKAGPPSTGSAVSGGQPASPLPPGTPETPPTAERPRASAVADASAIPTNLPGGATLNYTFDGYYEYNFNQPPGRVNDLREYDVLSNAFSINQAVLIFELAPDLEQHRRYGLRVDLQFGQATDTLQGNPANEPRPDIYRNLFQAYGTYVVPVGKGLNLGVGKWASSLGVEGTYTKDQMNYTRSFLSYFLPFYHEGVRAKYQVSDKLALNYWLVNGANQTEPTNGYKDELFGFVLTPSKNVTWTSNYYLGQEHPDNTQATSCTNPVQPGLCVNPVIPGPNGKTHIIDDYVTWQATSKLALTGEGDYFIQRLWKAAGPGESSAPQHLDGGAAYAQYQVTPSSSLVLRGEYMSDRNGLFSNKNQALKEVTGTYKRQVANNFDLFLEFRRDWTNIEYFRTHNLNALANHQTTATVGLVWWYGGKQGSW